MQTKKQCEMPFSQNYKHPPPLHLWYKMFLVFRMKPADGENFTVVNLDTWDGKTSCVKENMVVYVRTVAVTLSPRCPVWRQEDHLDYLRQFQLLTLVALFTRALRSMPFVCAVLSSNI